MAHLPINRIRTIMKTTDGVDSINKNAVFLVKVATEIFIRELTTEAHEDMKGARKLKYSNLVNVVHNNSRFEFLEYMIPKKITVKQFKKLTMPNAAGSQVQAVDAESSDEGDTTESGSNTSPTSSVVTRDSKESV